MYIDDFRNYDDNIDYYDQDDIYEMEFSDLPIGCPYRLAPPNYPPFSQGKPPMPFQPEPHQGPPPPPGPYGPQGGPPPSHGQHGPQGGPPAPPPKNVPHEPQGKQFGAETYAVDAGSIRRCMFTYVYIWPRRGPGFWAWITYVGRRSISGYRWSGNRWRYFGMDLREIRSFQCY
ncbi:MAG: transporter [Bacillota bacterium]|nr:transporter [Bacillota bacterium]